jgi:trehalose/maltose hydrolase-like predicted phosphorylase
MTEEIKENVTNGDNVKNNINIDEQPEPEITENEMKEIIDFINNWDYEKYERDSEVREALLLLRSKMKKEEEEKAQQLKELRIKEKNEIINNQIDNDHIEEKENQNDNIYIPDQINNNKINVELSEKEKEMLEKNWNSSTKPDYGEKIMNEKGDKEIIINNDKNEKKMKKVILL